MRLCIPNIKSEWITCENQPDGVAIVFAICQRIMDFVLHNLNFVVIKFVYW